MKKFFCDWENLKWGSEGNLMGKNWKKQKMECEKAPRRNQHRGGFPLCLTQ